jgi:hypothetical protein
MLDQVDGMVTSNTSFTDVVRDSKIKEYAVTKQTYFWQTRTCWKLEMVA